MKITAKTNCPLNNFEPCKELECAWFTHLRGTDPNTGSDIDEWACAVSWIPMLLIENSQQQRQTAASIESFRNEMSLSKNKFISEELTLPLNKTKSIEG